MAALSKDKIKIVIFCGGKGTRMWPVSNIAHPKQFNSLIGAKSFFRQTIERVMYGFAAQNIYLSTGKGFDRVLAEQAPEIPTANIILEPEMRDNTGAVALSAAKLNWLFPDAVMVLLWGADHMVKDTARFSAAIAEAARLAYHHDKIVHVDMRPTFPSIYNGWIRIGAPVKTDSQWPVYEFVRQVEKPDLAKAQQFFRSSEYLIHSGYMAVKPTYLLGLFQKFSPSTYQNVMAIARDFGTPREQETLNKLYGNFEKNSIDYTLFEKLPEGTQWDIPADIGWIDVGSWELMYHGLPKDKHGNLVIGKAEMIDVKNSLVIARQDKTMGLIGLDGMIVVDTDSGILACPMSQSARVKELYKQIFNKV